MKVIKNIYDKGKNFIVNNIHFNQFVSEKNIKTPFKTGEVKEPTNEGTK